MIDYTVTDAEGRVLRTGRCQPCDFSRQAGAGENVRERAVGDGAPPPPTIDDIELAIRARRARLLAASDWTQLPDVPLATKTAWAAYRQALRDITEQNTFPAAVAWPTSPQE